MSNAQLKVESSIEQIYDGSSYTNSLGSNYEYDGNGNLLINSVFFWDASVWVDYYRTLYAYNSNNKITEELEQKWSSGQYINTFRALYSYNSNGLLIEILGQNWVNNQWENSYRDTTSYNNSNQISGGISQEWDGSQWVNTGRSTLTYAGNNLTQSISEYWDDIQETYVYLDRQLYTYNSDNQIIKLIVEIWNGTSWEEEIKTEYIFDGNGNRTSETENYQGSITKNEYNYDTSVLLNNNFHPFKEEFSFLFAGFPIVNKITSLTRLSYNSSTSSFDILDRITYNYDNQIKPNTLSSQNFEVENKISIYPNPSSDFISINGLQKNENIKIYSVLGQIVKTINVVQNQKIDIKNLKDGIYFLKFNNGNTIKFMKK